MAGLTTVPVEVLLEIFKCEQLESVDLKNVRLAHPKRFGAIAGDVLFRTFHVHFLPKGKTAGFKATNTTVLQRIRKVIDGASTSSSSSADTGIVTAERVRQLSIVFTNTKDANGFTTFTRQLAQPLLNCFNKLEELKIELEMGKPGSRSRHYVYKTVQSGMNNFFNAFEGRCLDGELSVSRLVFSGLAHHVANLGWVSNLKSLRLTMEPGWGGIRGIRLDQNIAKILSNNPGLEELSLRLSYLRHIYSSWNGVVIFGRFMRDVFSHVELQKLAIKTLELSGIHPPLCKLSIGKLPALECLRFKGFLGSQDWSLMRSFRVQLKELECTTLLGNGVTKFIAGQEGLSRLFLLSAVGFDHYRTYLSASIVERERTKDNFLSNAQKFRDSALCQIYDTLTHLTLDAEVQLFVSTSGKFSGVRPSIRCQLVPYPHAVVYSETETADYGAEGPNGLHPSIFFDDLMDTLRGFLCLRSLCLKLLPLYSNGRILLPYALAQLNQSEADSKQWLDVRRDWPMPPAVCPKGWLISLKHSRFKEEWNEGMRLQTELPLWCEDKPGFVFDGMKAAWVLVKNGEDWGFEPKEVV